jgi:hypothetical protein
MWYNTAHEPISVEEAEALLADVAARHVAVTAIGDETYVSTMFVVLDYGWGRGAPILYETMIFGGPHDLYCQRYTTRDAALAGHDQAVALAKESVTYG